MERESQWRLAPAIWQPYLLRKKPYGPLLLSGAVAAEWADRNREPHKRAIWRALSSPEQPERTLAKIGGVSLYGVESFE